MFPRKIILSFALTLVFVTHIYSSAQAWNFAAFGDTRSPTDPTLVNTVAVTAIATDIATNRDCELAIIVGDYGQGSQPPSLASQFQAFKTAMLAGGLALVGSGNSGVPYYPVRGNHETNVADDENIWRSEFSTLPQNGPTTASGGGGNSEVGLTFSFTHEDAFFLGLDEYTNTYHRVNQDWIDQQLIGNDKHVFAFGHDPAYQAKHADCLAASQSDRDAFLTSLYQSGGEIYFCGHDHLNALSRVYEKDPAAGGEQRFYQFLVGAGGAPLATFDGVYNDNYPTDYAVTDLYHDSDPGAGISFHYAYAVVTVEDDSLWAKLYGTTSVDTPVWELLHTVVISGTMEGDADSITGDITNDATVTFNQASAGTYVGEMDGLGNLVKSGAGALTLSDTNTYTGTTTVNAGTLVVSGSCADSDVTVASGGILKGSGTVKSISNSGKVQPGNSVGTLNLNSGDFTQTAGGTLEIEVDSLLSYDQISGVGAAILDGQLTTINSGSYTLGDTLSDVIQTNAGISGAFSFLNTNISPTVIWKPQINGDNLDLVATRDYNNDVLQTVLSTNEQNIAAVLQEILPSASGDLLEIKSAIDGLQTFAQAREAYGQITPQRLNGLARLSFDTLSTQFYNLMQQLDYLRTEIEQAGFTLEANGAYAGSIANGVLLAYNANDAAKFIPRTNAQDQEPGTLGFFINGNGNFGDQETTESQPGFDYTAGGVTMGFDYRLRDNLILGVQSGYSGTEAEISNNGGDIAVDTVPIGISGLYFRRHAYVLAAIDFAWNTYDTKRRIQFGGLNRSADGTTQGRQLGALLKCGYDLEVKRFATGPTMSFDYHRLWIDDFSESQAGVLNAYIPEQRAESLQLGLGWQIAHRGFKMGKCELSPRFSVSYQHEFSNDSRAISSRLAEGGDTFQVRTEEPSRDFVLLGCGLAMQLNQGVSLDFNYQANVGQADYSAQSINGALRFNF